jgi:hypothetical protein
MATYTPIALSGATDGKNIKVVATATAGTIIHTAHATNDDKLWLWAHNSSATARLLTLEWGGVTDPDDLIDVTIPVQNVPTLIVPGWTITNSLVVRAFCAAAANTIIINGYGTRIS